MRRLAFLPSPAIVALVLELVGCAAADPRAEGDDDSGSVGTTTETGATSTGPEPESESSGSIGVVTGESSSTAVDGSDSSSSDSGGSETGGLEGVWTVEQHSCPGPSRTDALHADADGMWIGCGSNAVGYGLHWRHDDAWSPAETVPEGELSSFRVSAIARGDDGLLYVAGMDASDGDMVLALDTSRAPFATEKVLENGNLVGTSFHVGSMALLSGDRIFVESLTGMGALFRPNAAVGSDATTWDDAYYWANAGSPPGYQLQDLIAVDDRLYGSGATIAEPPYVFLPPLATDAEPYALVVRELPQAGTGEMWGVAANDARVVVVGVDQDADVGKIYVSGADPYDAAAYAQIDLPDIVGEGNLGTWARGVCMHDDRVVVVGERQPLGSGTGLVLISEDGGASFSNITPEGVTESVSKCRFSPNGKHLFVAGAGGFVADYE